MIKPQRLRGNSNDYVDTNARRRDFERDTDDIDDDESDESDYSDDDDDDDDEEDNISQLSDLSDADAPLRAVSIPATAVAAKTVKALTLDEISYDRGSGPKLNGSQPKQTLFDAGPPARKPRNRRPIAPADGQGQDGDKEARRRRRKERREKERRDALEGKQTRDSRRAERRDRRAGQQESVNKDRTVKPLKIMSRQAAPSGSVSLSGASLNSSHNRDGFSTNPSTSRHDPLSEAISALSIDPPQEHGLGGGRRGASRGLQWDPHTGEEIGFASGHGSARSGPHEPSDQQAAMGGGRGSQRGSERAQQRAARWCQDIGDLARGEASHHRSGRGGHRAGGPAHNDYSPRYPGDAPMHDAGFIGGRHGQRVPGGGRGRSGFNSGPTHADHLSRPQRRGQYQQQQFWPDSYHGESGFHEGYYGDHQGSLVPANSDTPSLRPTAREWQPSSVADGATLRPTAKEFAPSFLAKAAMADSRPAEPRDELSPAAPEYTPFGANRSFFNAP